MRATHVSWVPENAWPSRLRCAHCDTLCFASLARFCDQDIAQVECLAGLDSEFFADGGAAWVAEGRGVVDAICCPGDQVGENHPSLGIGHRKSFVVSGVEAPRVDFYGRQAIRLLL